MPKKSSKTNRRELLKTVAGAGALSSLAVCSPGADEATTDPPLRALGAVAA